MRVPLLLTTLAAFLLLQSPAIAQVTAPPGIVAAIEADGYTITRITRSLLGRIIITARGSTGLREVVINRQTGEILRDQLFLYDRLNRLAPRRGDTFRPGPPPRSGPPGGGRGGPRR